MLFARNRGAVLIGGAVVLLLGAAADPACAQCGCHRAAAMVPAPSVAMMPVTACAPACGVAPAPYHANRMMMWTPSYGIASTCNPLAAQSCGYGVVTAMTPVAIGGAPCGTYMAATPVATTTYRPFLYRLFHPFTPLVPTTTYRVAFCSPVAPCAPSCAPACGAMPSCGPAPSCGSACPQPTLNYAPACGSCAPAMGAAAPSGCASGGCAPAATETPTPTPSLPQTYAEPAPAAAPTPAPTNGGVIPQTYKDGTQPSTQPDVHLKPAPDTKSDAPSTGAPRLIDPVAQHTARPIWQATYMVPVSRSTVPETPAKQPVDFGGWRASRD